MNTTLSDEALRVIRRAWAGRLGVPPDVFASDQLVFVDRAPHPVVVVVRLGATTVVAAPEQSLASLRQLPAHLLLEAPALQAALDAERTRLIGTAQLSFADSGTFTPRRTPRTREASLVDVETVASACSAEEREESGLLEMETWWVVDAPAGQPMAAAGYEIWDEAIAHVGLAVAPRHRARGLGAAVATAAVQDALGHGAIPQWRSAGENAASTIVGKRLGFVPLGTQLAFVLTA